jgi:hypothetical protein
MATLILVLIALLVLSASFAGMLIFRPRAQGLRLSILAPIPGAVVAGVFGAAYLLSYAQAYRAVAVFVCLLVLAAWTIGFVLCGIMVLVNKRFRTVRSRSERHA